MKSKILTSMVVACAFALVNCDDTTSAVEDALQEQGGVPTSSSDRLAPTTTPEISSGSIVGGDNAAIPASSDSQGLSQGIEQGTVPASSAIGAIVTIAVLKR